MLLPFAQLDVFTSDAGDGNPLAVVHGADDLTTEQMQAFARWTNLSETTFILKTTDPAADYRVRIFTTSVEFPFAGHPTLGTAQSWLESGGVPATPGIIVQECGAGLVRVRQDGDRLAFAAPPLSRYQAVPEDDLVQIAGGLGVPRDAILDASWLANGPTWVGVRLSSAAEVVALTLDATALAPFHAGVVGPAAPGGDTDFEVRAFITTAGGGLVEDPATGSLNASLAKWLTDTGVAPASYVAAQGTVIGRAARLHVDLIGDDIWVGGLSRTVVSGTVEIPSARH